MIFVHLYFDVQSHKFLFCFVNAFGTIHVEKKKQNKKQKKKKKKTEKKKTVFNRGGLERVGRVTVNTPNIVSPKHLVNVHQCVVQKYSNLCFQTSSQFWPGHSVLMW